MSKFSIISSVAFLAGDVQAARIRALAPWGPQAIDRFSGQFVLIEHFGGQANADEEYKPPHAVFHPPHADEAYKPVEITGKIMDKIYEILTKYEWSIHQIHQIQYSDQDSDSQDPEQKLYFVATMDEHLPAKSLLELGGTIWQLDKYEDKTFSKCVESKRIKLTKQHNTPAAAFRSAIELLDDMGDGQLKYSSESYELADELTFP